MDRRGLTRETEIEDLDRAAAGQKQVLRLEVAMDDAFLVGRGQSERDLASDLGGSARDECSVVEPLSQGLALEELGDRVCHAVGDPEIVDGENVGVREGGHGAGLALEAPQSRRIPGELGGKHLDRDIPRELRIPRPVDFAHASRAERREDFVGAQTRPRRQGHRRTRNEQLCRNSGWEPGVRPGTIVSSLSEAGP